MSPTPRAFYTMSLVVIFVFGISGCGQKHLSVSTSSGKANEQEELEASLQDTPSEQTGIQDPSLTETGLGSELASQEQPASGTTDQEIAMVVEPPPLPTIRGASAEDPFETPDAAGGSTLGESDEKMDFPSNAEAEEGISNPSAFPTSLEPGLDSAHSGNGGAENGAPLAAIGSHETDPATQPLESSSEEDFDALGQPTDSEEDFGALGQPTEDQEELIDSPHVERIPENIVVAKVESSEAIEDQLARIKEEEMATAAAGLQDIYFEFDSWKITEEGKDLLEKNANLLQDDTDMNLLIEGHCDQRGTQAYNIVLGKKRALAIRDYLVGLGVEPTRLSVVTYGKEKPFCTDETEFCYQENRRGHLIVQ